MSIPTAKTNTKTNTNNPSSKDGLRFESDLRFSHVDIVVDDIQIFLSRWVPRLGLISSEIYTWGGPGERTWSKMAFVFDPFHKQLMFMVVQGNHGVHVDLLEQYGSGSIYRLCFKTDQLEHVFDHLQKQGTVVTNLEGDPVTSFSQVLERVASEFCGWKRMANCPWKSSRLPLSMDTVVKSSKI